MPLGNIFGGWHLLIILLVILLLFGATRLPKLSESLGKSIRIFKKTLKDEDSKSDKSGAASPDNKAKDGR